MYIYTYMYVYKHEYMNIGLMKAINLDTARVLIVNGIVIAWGTRLSTFLFTRVLKLGEDKRLDKVYVFVIYIYMYVYIYTYMDRYLRVYFYVLMHVYMYIYTCIHRIVCMYIHVDLYI
jgi:steroid 5-alpha reductase family enzyme